jgi:hypothetical protein
VTYIHLSFPKVGLNDVVQVWVRDVCEATHVLDIDTGNLIEKDRVFLQNYSRVGVSMDLALASQGQMFSSQRPQGLLPSMPSHRGSVGSPFSGAGGSVFGQGPEGLMSPMPMGSCPVTTGIPGQLSISRSPPSANMSEGN